MLNKALALFILIVQIIQCYSKTYDNYTLYRGIPISEEHLNFYRDLSSKYEINFWRQPGQIRRPVDFVIAPKDQPAFIREVIRNGLYLTTVIEDIQSAFRLQKIKSYIRRRTESFDWMHYYRLNDIYVWLRDLASLYPKKMKLRVIGTTHEKREIIAVLINHQEISRRDYRSLPLKKVMVEGGIHAREWISSAFVTYFLHAILYAPYSDDDDFKKMAYMYEWHFVPVLNPDGYEHCHTKDRLWRKNRNGDGVDINRNFAYNFGKAGVSFKKRSEIYAGESEFSENESKAMASLIKQHSRNLEFYFSFHSYGQFIIIPYADSKTHLQNFDAVKSTARSAARDIEKLHGRKYTIGTAYDTVGYMTTGVSSDWVKSQFGTNVVCTFELRDTGNFGFALPPDQIIPTCEETMEAMKVFLMPKKRLRKNDDSMFDAQGRTILDTMVIVFNVLLFIIVRFDYLHHFISV